MKKTVRGCWVAASLMSLVGLAATPAHALMYSWTNQGVTFDLDVQDLGATVTASLDVTADNTGDILHAVSIKIFSGDPPSGSGSLTAAPISLPGAYAFAAGAFGGGSYGTLGPANTGFVSALHSVPGGGVSMTTPNTYTFDFSWTTNVSPLATPSIKAWSSVADPTSSDFGKKSRQWSSGDLTPPEVPVPSSLVGLISLATTLGGVSLFRRRR